MRKDNGENSMIQGSNKYMSRLSTNAHLDDIERLLDNSDSSRMKNINVSPGRVKKISDLSSNYIYNKDTFQNIYKIPVPNNINNQINVKPSQINNFSTLKIESPYRKKDDKLDIIDRIISENKDKFYDEVNLK